MLRTKGFGDKEERRIRIRGQRREEKEEFGDLKEGCIGVRGDIRSECEVKKGKGRWSFTLTFFWRKQICRSHGKVHRLLHKGRHCLTEDGAIVSAHGDLLIRGTTSQIPIP